jgi:hypothetical protein
MRPKQFGAVSSQRSTTALAQVSGLPSRLGTRLFVRRCVPGFIDLRPARSPREYAATPGRRFGLRELDVELGRVDPHALLGGFLLLAKLVVGGLPVAFPLLSPGTEPLKHARKANAAGTGGAERIRLVFRRVAPARAIRRPLFHAPPSTTGTRPTRDLFRRRGGGTA